MSKIALKYFSGTGNSLRVLEICSAHFKSKGHDTVLSSITYDKEDDYSTADLIGFFSPIHAYNLPRISRRLLETLPRSENRQKVFLLVSAGALDESGFALGNGKKVLEKKGYDVIYTDVIEMPSNWITFAKSPAKDLAAKIVEKGEQKASEIANNILVEKYYHHKFNYPERMGYLRFYFEYFTYHKIGIHQMWKIFKVYSSCNSCGLCEKLCPTKGVVLKDGTPCWNSACEQCMRCVNFCPQQAIYQAYGGETKGKNRYYEPHFKPSKRDKK